MTEHDDKQKKPAEAEDKQVTHSEWMFRLGAFLLSALLFTILLLVGSSFSRIVSEGEVSTDPFSLSVATFDAGKISAEDAYREGEEVEDKQLVLYAFEITNTNEVDITYDMEFDITITVEGDQFDPDNLKQVTYILVDENYEEEAYAGNYIDFSNGGGETGLETMIEGSTDPETDTVHDWPAFYLEKEGSTTIMLIMNFEEYYDSTHSTGEITITVEGTIYISKITQTAEGSTE